MTAVQQLTWLTVSVSKFRSSKTSVMSRGLGEALHRTRSRFPVRKRASP